jgi:hypothetical protein
MQLKSRRVLIEDLVIEGSFFVVQILCHAKIIADFYVIDNIKIIW